MPLDVFVADFPFTRLEEARQKARRRTLKSDVYSSFIFRRKSLRGQMRVGLRGERTQLDSDLLAVEDAMETSLGASFRNATRQSLLVSYLNQTYTLDRSKSRWQLSLPLALHQLGLQDEAAATRTDPTAWVIRPELEYLLRLPRERILTFSYNFNRDYDRDQLYFNGYLLRQNRQFDRTLLTLNRFTEHTLTARFQGTDQTTKVSYNSYLTVSAARADFLSTTVFDTTGRASVLQESGNTRRRLSWQNRFSGTLFKNIQLQLEANYRLIAQPIDLNGRRVTAVNHFITIAPQLTYTFSTSALSCQPGFNYYGSNLADVPVREIHLWWKYLHRFGKKGGDLHLTFNQYRTAIGERRIDNHLLNVRYANRIGAEEWEVSLALNNLTNTGSFVAFNQGTYFEEVSYFRLRGRQVVVMVGRKF
ncbi:MAG: hypothetical protein WBA17_10775 [Saprospiraceae bacterium]